MTKALLRQKYKERRKELSTEEVNRLSQRLTKQVENWLAGKKDMDHVHLFFPIAKFNEVNTFYIKESLDRMGKVLYTSQVNRETGGLDTLKLPEEATFFLDPWDIPVPQESLKVTSTKIQLVFVPLFAYDIQGNRVGFGKGFYDSFLQSFAQPVVKVGLSFFGPEENCFPESYDVALDYCITPDQVWAFGTT